MSERPGPHPEHLDRRALAPAEAREFAKERLEDWQAIPELARRLLRDGDPKRVVIGVCEELAATRKIWLVFSTFNHDRYHPKGVGVDCTTGEFCTLSGQPVGDDEVGKAARMRTAVNGSGIRRLLENKLNDY